MGKQVRIKPDFTMVPLTLGSATTLYSGGETVVLTDVEFAALPAATSRALLVLASVADPPRAAAAVAAAPGDFLTRRQVEDLIATFARPVSTDGANGLPAPSGRGVELVITASGLQDIRMNGVSL